MVSLRGSSSRSQLGVFPVERRQLRDPRPPSTSLKLDSADRNEPGGLISAFRDLASRSFALRTSEIAHPDPNHTINYTNVPGIWDHVNLAGLWNVIHD